MSQEANTPEHRGPDGDLPEPIQRASIMGPHSPSVERENPSLLASPQTDYGTIPSLKFPSAGARDRLLMGGWTREVTVRKLPIATELAGVNMRLKPGGMGTSTDGDVKFVFEGVEPGPRFSRLSTMNRKFPL